MKRHFAVAALIAAPTALFAQSQLDRLEALSEQMNELMMVKMVEEMVAETGADPAPVMELIPDMSWDAEFRAAGECMIDAYRDKIGRGGVDEMLTAMEEAMPRIETMSMEEMGDELDFMPDGITVSETITIQQDCGMMEVAMERMSSSGFMEAMFAAAAAAEE